MADKKKDIGWRSKDHEGTQEEVVDKTPEEAEKIRADKKARLVQALERGLTSSKLDIPGVAYMPELQAFADAQKVYAWARDTQDELDRLHGLGFTPETEKGKGLHGKGDSRRVVGDVVLVSTSRENYELLHEIKTERKSRRAQRSGKKEYLAQARTNPDVPVIDPQNVGTG